MVSRHARPLALDGTGLDDDDPDSERARLDAEGIGQDLQRVLGRVIPAADAELDAVGCLGIDDSDACDDECR